MNVNKLILIGRVGKDPEMHTFPNGDLLAKFSLATDDSYKDKQGAKVEQTDWHNVRVTGKLVDVVQKYVHKGDLLFIEGKIKTRSYEKDGVIKYLTEVYCNQLTMLGNKSDKPQYEPTLSPEPVANQGDTDEFPF